MDLDDFDEDIGLQGASVKPIPRPPSRFIPKSAKPMPKQEPHSHSHSHSHSDIATLSKQQKQEDGNHHVEPSLDNTLMEEQEVGSKPEPMTIDRDNEEGEDQIVREIDVFFIPSLQTGTQLYVMQYPLRPSWRPYELAEKCQEVRINPKEGKLEVDLLLDTATNYDHDAADRLRISKQTLSSQRSPLTTSYAVGILMGNKLHLNPVDAVLQLRPSMAHLTPRGLKRNHAAENVESGMYSDEITGVKDSSSSKRQGRMVKAATTEVADVEESWISIDYHGMDSSDSSLTTRYRLKMTSQENFEIPFSMSPFEYINSLCPVSCTKNQERSLSKRSLLSLPLEDRFKKWLSEGPQLNRFSVLKHLAPDYPCEDVLGILQRHSWLVQGLWVPKSTLRNSKDPVARDHIIGSVARDYVIGLFKKNTVVSCNEFTKLDEYQLIKKEAESHLNTLAVYRPSCNEWELKEPKDVSFINSYPDIVKKQEGVWADQEKKIMDFLKKRKSRCVDKNSSRPGSESKPRTSVNADQAAKVHVNGAACTKLMTIPNESLEALRKALEALLRKHNVCSWSLICQSLKEQGILKSDTDPLPELNSVIDQIAIKVSDVYVLKSLGDPTLDPLRRVVIDLFCGKEPNAKLKRADIFEAAKIQLKRDVSPKEYTQVMNQLCICAKRSSWVLKGCEGKST